MERGRSNYLRLLGADQHALFAEAESRARALLWWCGRCSWNFCAGADGRPVEIVTRPLDVSVDHVGQEVRRGELLLSPGQVAFPGEGWRYRRRCASR